jgi:hypothetical protein
LTDDLSPHRFERALPLGAAEAFAVYVDRIGEWWDPRYTANADSLVGVTIEQQVGGRAYAMHSDMGRDDWGEILVWEPGLRLVHTFTLAQDPAHPSEISAEFEDRGGGSVLQFAHGGWTVENARDRAKFGEWPLLLDRFAALAGSL